MGAVDGGGRTALNLAGIGADELHRGDVLTADPDVRATDRALVTFLRPIADRPSQAPCRYGRRRRRGRSGRARRAGLRKRDDGRDRPPGRTDRACRGRPVRAAPGPGHDPVGGMVLDATPPRGISRRRQTSERVERLAATVARADRADIEAARLDLHGASGRALAPDVLATAAGGVRDRQAGGNAGRGPGRGRPGHSRSVTIQRDAAALAAASLVDDLVEAGRLIRAAERIRLPGALTPGETGPDPARPRRWIDWNGRLPSRRRRRSPRRLAGRLSSGRDQGPGTGRADRRDRAGHRLCSAT